MGQRMRADLAASLLHNPKVLYLDEPTIGLDITVKENMRQFIRRINKERGTTVILTSHDLQDIEDICERVIVIDEGRIVTDVATHKLQEMYAHDRGVRAVLKRPDPQVIRKLSEDSKLHVAENDAHTITAMFNINDYTAYEVIHKIGQLTDISDITVIEPDIKQVIEKVYRSELVVKEESPL